MLIKVTLLILGAVILQFAMKTLIRYDVFRNVYNHTPGPCRIVEGEGVGYEDMETLPNGLTLITSGVIKAGSAPKLIEYSKKRNAKGKIFLFDFNQPDKGIEEIKIVGDQFNQSDFIPHGISLWSDSKDKVIAMIVNHGTTGDSIEKFDFSAKDNTLRHLRTYKDPSIHLVNDVAMDSENSFYFTNFAYYKTPTLHLIEMLLSLRYGNLMYYDGKAYNMQYDGLALPNGVVLSRDQQHLYVGESLSKKVHVYKRGKDGRLSEYQTVDLYSTPDNPTLDIDGNVVFGSQPVAWQTTAHLNDPEISAASSQVLKLHIKDGKVNKITEIFSDDGNMLQGSSVASLYKDGMLVGTILQKLLYCKVHWVD